jgi:hypothetical protein
MSTKPGAFTAGDVLTAASMNLLPAGSVGRATSTSTTNVTATETDISGLSVTWTAVSSRLYRLSFQVYLNSGTGSVYTTIALTDGANNLSQQYTYHNSGVSGEIKTVTGFLTVNALSGSTTRKLRIARVGGANYALGGDAFRVHRLLVEDIGPA